MEGNIVILEDGSRAKLTRAPILWDGTHSDRGFEVYESDCGLVIHSWSRWQGERSYYAPCHRSYLISILRSMLMDEELASRARACMRRLGITLDEVVPASGTTKLRRRIEDALRKTATTDDLRRIAEILGVKTA